MPASGTRPLSDLEGKALNRGIGLRAFLGTRQARIVLVTGLGAVVSAGLLIAFLVPRGAAQNPNVEKSWPSFTMQFMEKQFDPNTGKQIVDQTYRLVVVDDNTWRADIVADALHPAQVGSFFAVKNQVYYTYGAAGHTFATRPVEDNTVVAIAPDLYPGVYSRITDGADKGWSFMSGSPPTSIADIVNVPMTTATKQDMVTCGTATPGTAGSSCSETKRIDFATNTIATGPAAGNQVPRGGIPVYAEDRVNGVLVRQLVAASLQLTPSAAIVAPTQPPGAVKPATVVNGLPAVTVSGTAAPSSMPIRATPTR